MPESITSTDPSSILAALIPTGKATLMSLLEGAGHDIAHWAKNADGSVVATPAANPNYCYDWAFGSAREPIVLCVWHSTIKPEEGRLIYSENLRKLNQRLALVANDPMRSSKDRNRSRQQATRAGAFDERVKIAYEDMLPIRFIINVGNRASEEELGAATSQVSLRMLDAVDWYVHEYDAKTGENLIVRGVKRIGDLIEVDEDGDDEGPTDERQLRAIQSRRGQREFRAKLLSAWKCRCAVTGSSIDGLLEAAHIVPHAEGGSYRTSNGLLLRSDIHTLFDLGLISVDEFYRVHISKKIEFSEYRQYHGRTIDRCPDHGSDAPAREGLRKRHAQFLARSKGHI